MDGRLVAWGRAVKSRLRARPGPHPPPLWLFTDPARMDVRKAVAALPPGLCGVVLRHDAAPGRRALVRHVARLCRARRLALVVTGRDSAPGAGRHGRGGRFGGPRAGRGWTSSSAHGAAELTRARRAGADLVFLSPVFPTASHPGAPALGVLRWAALAHTAGVPVLALGGVDGRSVRRLPRWARGAGAITALLG